MLIDTHAHLTHRSLAGQLDAILDRAREARVERIICAAAMEHGELPRRISFTRTCVIILTAWSNLSLGLYSPKALKLLLKQIASLKIPHRPGRLEPRVLKRRRHRYPLMRKPRQKLKQRLKSTTRLSKMT